MTTFALHAPGPRLSFWWPVRRIARDIGRISHTMPVRHPAPSSVTRPVSDTPDAAAPAADVPANAPASTASGAPDAQRSAHERERDFEAVALRWLPDVARFARSLTRDEQAADDLVQETFLRAWRHWDTFRAGSEARAWLFTIARNAWHRTGTKAARYVPVEDEVLEAFAGEDYPMAAPTEVTHLLARADLGPAITAAVAALPEPFRLVVELVELQEVPYAEAATILDIPIGTVRSRLFRARRLLQEALVEHARDLGLVPPSDDTETRT